MTSLNRLHLRRHPAGFLPSTRYRQTYSQRLFTIVTRHRTHHVHHRDVAEYARYAISLSSMLAVQVASSSSYKDGAMLTACVLGRSTYASSTFHALDEAAGQSETYARRGSARPNRIVQAPGRTFPFEVQEDRFGQAKCQSRHGPAGHLRRPRKGELVAVSTSVRSFE